MLMLHAYVLAIYRQCMSYNNKASVMLYQRIFDSLMPKCMCNALVLLLHCCSNVIDQAFGQGISYAKQSLIVLVLLTPT